MMPATPAVKLLDPLAGDGLFLEVAAQAWHVTPYANELDGERAQSCIKRFGPKQAVRCDVERLLASNNAFGAARLNPPYDHDKTAKANNRVEFAYLRYSWKWLQEGGLAVVHLQPTYHRSEVEFTAKLRACCSSLYSSVSYQVQRYGYFFSPL